MASPTLTFGTNKQIKFGLDDNSIIDYNQQNQSDLKRELIELLTGYESLFDGQQIPVDFNLPNFKHAIFQKSSLLEPNQEPASWRYDNPPFDKQKQDWLNDNIPKLEKLGIISEVKYTKEPKYLNSVNVTLNKNNEFELNPDFSELNKRRNFHNRMYLSRKDKTEKKYMNIKNYFEFKIFTIPASTKFSLIMIKDFSYKLVLGPNYRKYTTFKLKICDIDRYYQFNTLHPNMLMTSIYTQRHLEKNFEGRKEQSKMRIIDSNILILSKTIKDHIRNFKEILIKLKVFNVKISLEDSMILFNELEIRDFWLDSQGISISQRIKDQFKNFQPYSSMNLESKEKFQNFCENYKNFFQKSDYKENKEKLLQPCRNYDYRLGLSDNAITFYKKAFSLPLKIPYHNLQPNAQQYLLQNLQRYLKQYLQQNPHLQQNLEQIIQKFQQQYLQEVQQSNLTQNPQQIIQQYLQQYLEQNKDEFVQQKLQEINQQRPLENTQQNLQQYIHSNPDMLLHLTQITTQFLVNQEQNPHLYLNPHMIQHLKQIIQQYLLQYLQKNPPQNPSRNN